MKMLKVLTYPDIDPVAWQALVDRSPYATWFQTKEAYEFYAANPSEMTPFAFAISENERLMGVVVGYSTVEKNPIKQFFTCRSIIIGGPLLDEEISDEAVAALLFAVRQVKGYRLKVKGTDDGKAEYSEPNSLIASSPHRLKDSIYIETRNFHDYSRWRHVFEQCGFEYQPHLNIHVACNTVHSMSEQRIRQAKKALKNGAEVVLATTEQEIRDFYGILHQLYREKVRTPLFTEAFFLRFHQL